ncbi:MAG: hypothetical protein U1E45_12235 [Geminicoccaceae bacterium]
MAELSVLLPGPKPEAIRRIEGAVLQTLHLGAATLDQLADLLQSTRRAIVAEVAGMNGSRALSGDVRHHRAGQLLQRPELTMARIAELPGYSEPGALNHAFRRRRPARAAGRRFDQTVYSPEPISPNEARAAHGKARSDA